MAKLNVKTGQSAGIVDFFNWKRFSSLQKLLTIATVVIAVSWLSSLWTLLILFLLCVAGALRISNKIGHHETGPLIAENIILKLEEGYMWFCNILNSSNVVVKSHADRDGGEMLVGQKKLDDSHLFSEMETDKALDGYSSSANIVSGPVLSEINSLQLLIIRDFVQSWYSTFSYNNQFLKESKYVIQQSCNSIAVSLSHQNPQGLTTSLLKKFREHVTMYMRAKSVFESHLVHPKTKVPKDSIKRFASIEEAFQNQFGFHEALMTNEDEINYSRGIISIILLNACCPKSTTDGICTRTLLVEIMTNNVFLPLIQMISDPDWLMEKIILLTSEENVESDQNMIHNFDASKAEGTLNSDPFSNQNISSTFQESVLDKSEPTSIVMKFPSDSYEETERSVRQDPENAIETKNDQELYSKEKNKCKCEEAGNSILKSSNESQNKCDSDEDRFFEISLPCESEKDGDSLKDEEAKFFSRPELASDKIEEINCLENSHDGSIASEDNIFFKQFSDDTSVKSVDLKEENHQNSSPNPSECSDRDELITDSYESAVIETDPQKILAYSKSIPTSSSGKTQTPSEPLPSTFPKLSSIKSFFAGSFKPGTKNSNVQKPKTLDLFPTNIKSSFNPLSRAKSVNRDRNSSSSNDNPPVVLVDGKPADNISPDRNSVCSSQLPESRNESSDTRKDVRVSPGFFSSFQPFFSKSSSQNDLTVSNVDMLEESPAVTPSPTDAASLDIDLSAENHDVKQYDGKLLDQCSSEDQRIIQDISIPNAFTNQEFRSSSQYSLYVIEYHALYFNDDGKTILKTGEVKRRHREFTNLQSRLECLPTFKKYMKNIRGPRRWPTLPFKSLDKETVESRRQFLEKYLQKLISIEAICNGPDLREFLAYEGDSHIAFVKKSPDISVPRIDKMLMRGVSEVVDKLKSIPNIPSEVMSGLRNKDSVEEKVNRPANYDADNLGVNTIFAREGTENVGSIMDFICHQLTTDHDNRMKDDFDQFNMSHVIKDLKSFERTQETYRQEVDKLLSTLPKMEEEGINKMKDEAEKKQRQPSNMCPVLLELLVQGLQDRNNWICNEQVVKLLQAFFGKAVNSYMDSTIKELTSNSQLVIYLRLLRETIWPQGQLWSNSTPPKSDEEKAATREKAKQCLKKFFPVILRKFVGDEDFDAILEVYINCLHHPKLNKHLLYHLLDFLAEHLFPETTSCDLLQTLLFSNTSLDNYV